MKLLAYADESGTHVKRGVKQKGANPCVLGFIASIDCWDKFCTEWKAVLDKYGVAYFHFRETNASLRSSPTNPYYGWDDNRTDDFIHDLAMVAARGPVPFGGNAHPEKNPDPYKKSLEQFFEDFSFSMTEHWPEFVEKVDFFFEENENTIWKTTLNSVITSYQRIDSRIGGYSFAKWNDFKHGLPLQAADMIAYVSRQAAERLYETGKLQPQRIIDLILFKNLRPKNHPWHYGDMSLLQWELLIMELRNNKKIWDMTNKVMGKKKQPYYPLFHHPFFQKRNPLTMD